MGGHLLGLDGADENFKPHFIVGPPSNPAMRDAYERALDLLQLPRQAAEVVEVSEAKGLVDRIAKAVWAHEGAG